MKKLTLNVTKVFGWNYNCKTRVAVNIGGARSSKSYSIAQILIMKLLNEKQKRFLIIRKTLPSLRLSAYRLFIELLSEYGMYRKAKHNRSERTIYFRDSFVHFTGLDDPEKIKSTEWNYIWMEEANEFTWDDFVVLKTRMSAVSADGNMNRMYLSLNPSDESGWVRQKLELRKPDDITFFYSSYKDNRFLSEDYKELLEELKHEDETYYKIYTLGEWAAAGDMIFSGWEIIDSIPCECDEIIYGLDFGFNNPTCLLKLHIKDGDIFIEQLIYERKMTNEELIQRMKQLSIARNDIIYADAAEPNRIEEISRWFNIKSAAKDVNQGIDHVKRKKLKIINTSADVINEIKMYKWKTDRNGLKLDAPVKFNDHTMDALRYAVYTHFRKEAELKMLII